MSQTAIQVALDRVKEALIAADKVTPRGAPGSPEAVVKWRIQDMLIRCKRAREAWDPPEPKED